MAVIGYGRTSTLHQDAGLDAQLRQLEALGCDKIFSEQVSSVADRVRLTAALEYVREGDTFVVTKLDRLARSVAHLVEIVGALEGKGVALKILDLGMDTSTPTGRLMLTVIGAIAQFEREIMIERQREGIAAAKAEGNTKAGRQPPDARLMRSASSRLMASARLRLRGGSASGNASFTGCSRRTVEICRQWRAADG